MHICLNIYLYVAEKETQNMNFINKYCSSNIFDEWVEFWLSLLNEIYNINSWDWILYFSQIFYKQKTIARWYLVRICLIVLYSNWNMKHLHENIQEKFSKPSSFIRNTDTFWTLAGLLAFQNFSYYLLANQANLMKPT